VTTILAIPTDEDSEDEWAWHFDEKGLFSVKSAYRLHRQLAHGILMKRVHSLNRVSIGRKFGKQNVPQMYCIFSGVSPIIACRIC
jgi:hypothetical protein